jgi:hypothetical protein
MGRKKAKRGSWGDWEARRWGERERSETDESGRA